MHHLMINLPVVGTMGVAALLFRSIWETENRN
jgi:hypothetical protein